MNRRADHSGEIFNKWTVIKRVADGPRQASRYLFRCECGTERDMLFSIVAQGKVTDCGCTRPHHVRIGQVFTRWTIIGEPVLHGKRARIKCRCQCGTERDVDRSNLLQGLSQSCGCLKEEITSKLMSTHGATVNRLTPEYVAWCCMRRRCKNPNEPGYHNYGGRGISVCERWDSFENFLKDVGLRPTPNHSIDREDNSGNYEPGNVKWSTRTEQNRNTRRCHYITANGMTKTITEWSEITGLARKTIRDRINSGLDTESAINTPSQRRSQISHY